MKSLLRDQNDAKALRGTPEQPIPSFRKQIGIFNPFFFTKEGAALPLCGHFRDASGFLLAGGPSAQEVDLSKLKRVWTMTLNNAHTSFRGNAACFVDEPGRFSMSMWLDPTIMKMVPMSHFDKPLWDNRSLQTDGKVHQKWEPSKLVVGDCPNVVGYRRNEKFNAGRWLYEETINWGNHSKYGGGRSVLLAAIRIFYLLGFRHVYLVGVDFDMSPTKRYHFAEDRDKGAIRGNMSTYSKLKKWFKELQPFFLKEGFIVKNCNMQSKLQAFPFMPYEEAISEATSHLGSLASERTVGMYRKWEDKLKAVNGAVQADVGDLPAPSEKPAGFIDPRGGFPKR